jgi:hypothetical protein
MIVRNSKFRSMTGSMTGCAHFLHSWVAKGGKSPEMNVLAWQRPHVTIFNGLPAPVASLLTITFYHRSPARQVWLRHEFLEGLGLGHIEELRRNDAVGP